MEQRGAETAAGPMGAVTTTETRPATGTAEHARFAWLRYPDFWLAVALAALLRLWRIETAQFLDDQAAMMRLARAALAHGALLVTGIPTAGGTPYPPASEYALMPFALFTANPLPGVVAIALWNVAGVALIYIFAARSFGRWAAATAALLLATNGAAIGDSRLIQPASYLPPLLILWAWTLFSGRTRGRGERRGRWFVLNAALLAVAVQLSPSALVLVLVTVVAVAVAVAPRATQPPKRAYALAAGLVLVLFIPTLLWQAASGADPRGLVDYALGLTNLDVFHPLFYTSAFIAAGVGVQAAVTWAQARQPGADFGSTVARAMPAILGAVLTLAVVVQSILWASHPAALASGQFDAYAGYGYPLSEVQQADAALASLQQQQHAASVSLSLPTEQRYRAPLDELLVGEHANRSAATDDCLVLPAPAANTSALLVVVEPQSLAGQLAPRLSNVKPVADVQVPGGAPWAVYSVTGTPAALPDEQTIQPVTFADAAGNGLRLEGFAMTTDGLVRLRWTVLGSGDRATGTPWYRIQPTATDGATATPLASTECQPTHWQAGQTVFTWASLAGLKTPPPTLKLLVRGGTLMPRLTTVGPLPILAGGEGGQGLQTLPPASGEKTADGALALPLGVIGLP